MNIKLKVKVYFTFIFFIFSFSVGYTQNDVSTTIKKIFGNIRSKKIEGMDTKILFKKENARSTWALLIPYYSDSLAKVRDKAYSLTASIALNTKDDNMRKSVVNYLLIGCSDLDLIVAKNCSNALEGFQITDFNAKATSALLNLIKINKNNIGHNAQLAAFVGVENLENILLNLLEEKIPNKEKWAIRLALARIGHMSSVAYVYEKVKSVPINDDVILEAIPALVYTRNRESFNYMITIIQSDKKNCTSAHPDSDEPVLCGYRVLEYVSPYIADFPVKTLPSGDLQGDYTKALQTARKWFNEKGLKYSLNLNTF